MNILEGIFKSTWLQFALNFIVLVISVILLKIVINRFSANLVKRQPEQKGQIDLGKRILNSIVYLLAAYVLIQEIPVLSKMATSLLAGSSIVALVIGFASQEALTNVVSGAFIIFFKPFVIGDRILLPEKNLTGFVEDISLRHTVLRTIQNTRVIVPNATVNKAILENYDYKDKRRLNFFRIGVAYETDLNRAMAIIEEEIVKHPNFLDSRSEQEKAEGVKACVARVAELANSAIFLSAGAWSKDYGSGFVMMTELNKIIKERFDQEKIKITYPYQKIELSQ
ncbi:MAG: mechanosensitive ion channel family protein [Firmicutes bacterium]|nr:mechanosensitive ion channel family protein [Bacillota bacterium]